MIVQRIEREDGSILFDVKPTWKTHASAIANAQSELDDFTSYRFASGRLNADIYLVLAVPLRNLEMDEVTWYIPGNDFHSVRVDPTERN